MHLPLVFFRPFVNSSVENRTSPKWLYYVNKIISFASSESYSHFHRCCIQFPLNVISQTQNGGNKKIKMFIVQGK